MRAGKRRKSKLRLFPEDNHDDCRTTSLGLNFWTGWVKLDRFFCLVLVRLSHHHLLFALASHNSIQSKLQRSIPILLKSGNWQTSKPSCEQFRQYPVFIFSKTNKRNLDDHHYNPGEGMDYSKIAVIGT